MHIKKWIDDDTWMVSVLHPSLQSGSSFWSDRGGKTPLEAATGYMTDDPRDNAGAALVKKDPQTSFICVVSNQVASNLKPWKVYLFVLDENGQVVPF